MRKKYIIKIEYCFTPFIILLKATTIEQNHKKKCYFAIRSFFGTTPLLSSYHLFEKEKVAYFSMKSRSFASFSKVDFFYMESDLRGPQVLKAPTNSGFCDAFSALNMSNGGPIKHTSWFFE